MTNSEILAKHSEYTVEEIDDSERVLFGQDQVLSAMDAAREDEAIRFAEWYDKIFIKTGTIRDLYLKYKKQNP